LSAELPIKLEQYPAFFAVELLGLTRRFFIPSMASCSNPDPETIGSAFYSTRTGNDERFFRYFNVRVELDCYFWLALNLGLNVLRNRWDKAVTVD